ncbi:MAG: hypothetical protein HZA50_12425 [Planctomycetes bacterium]|nr:hypothetical protein [Planctomycetota bacterium]
MRKHGNAFLGKIIFLQASLSGVASGFVKTTPDKSAKPERPHHKKGIPALTCGALMLQRYKAKNVRRFLPFGRRLLIGLNRGFYFAPSGLEYYAAVVPGLRPGL